MQLKRGSWPSRKPTLKLRQVPDIRTLNKKNSVCKRKVSSSALDVAPNVASVAVFLQLGKYKGPHPSPGGERILQALRLGGAGK
jgi:hypothetical protein